MKLDLAREIVAAIIADDPTDACAPALQTVLDELDRQDTEIAAVRATIAKQAREIRDLIDEFAPGDPAWEDAMRHSYYG